MKQFLPDDAIPLLSLVVEHPVQIVGDQVERVVEASHLDVATEKEGNVIELSLTLDILILTLLIASRRSMAKP